MPVVQAVKRNRTIDFDFDGCWWFSNYCLLVIACLFFYFFIRSKHVFDFVSLMGGDR